MVSPDLIGNSQLAGAAPRITIQLKLHDERVAEASFLAFGCGVTIAACSMLTELVIGRSLSECRRLQSVDLIDALGGIPPDRQFCADLAIAALKNAVCIEKHCREP